MILSVNGRGEMGKGCLLSCPQECLCNSHGTWPGLKAAWEQHVELLGATLPLH